MNVIILNGGIEACKFNLNERIIWPKGAISLKVICLERQANSLMEISKQMGGITSLENDTRNF